MTDIINADGQTQTIYFSQVGGSVKYKINNGSLNDPIFPLTISNINTNPLYTLKVLFETNITLNSIGSYFECGSDNIQFGSTSLNPNGTRPQITIENLSNYPGLIKNSNGSVAGKNNIYVYNIKVVSSGTTTLDTGGGWIGQAYFGSGCTNNYIVNCSSEGDISQIGGGIVGSGAATTLLSLRPSLYIIGCSSSGDIGDYGGGIAGSSAGAGVNNLFTPGQITCDKCWSEGDIGLEAGGIFGNNAGQNYGEANATKCYSIGLIGSFGGGIFGRYAAENNGIANASYCYSNGPISSDGGGIFGANAGATGGTPNAINCYSSGTFNITGTGIYGTNSDDNLSQCYSANGSWNSGTALSFLGGTQSSVNPVGNTWVYTTLNQPYQLNNMGYSPYSLTNIITTPTPDLNQEYDNTLQAGQQATPVIPGLTYTLLQITGGDPASYGTISIVAGTIVTTSATAPGSYTIYVRSSGSYNITIFGLTITSSASGSIIGIPPCCQPICPQFNQTTNNTQEQLAVKKASVAIASDIDSTYLAINQNRSVNFIQPAFANYRDYMTYLQSKYR